MKKTLAFLLIGFEFLVTTEGRASDPIGIYAKVDRVIMEPNEQVPERVQIWGVFALADTTTGKYQKPARGYLYYSLVPGSEALCRNEWSDLANVAGSDHCVAFGRRHEGLGKVREASELPTGADLYPLAIGVFKVPSFFPECRKLE